jgi:hypothetical protein
MVTDYRLSYGTHANPDDGRCAMEWVSLLAGEPHSDEPACVSPVLRAFCTTLNDSLEDEPRQRLRLFLARTIGTADDGFDEARSWMAMDWLIRTYAPSWLRVAGLTASAERLAALPTVLDSSPLKLSVDELNLARRETRASWAAIAGPVRGAGWAPRAAGRATARETAWRSAGAAAWAAARVAVGDITGDRARAVAREIGGDAAAIVAREARAGVGQTTARKAATAALAPIVTQLEQSVFLLLDRMLPTAQIDALVVGDHRPLLLQARRGAR